jgi:hypothetical protein
MPPKVAIKTSGDRVRGGVANCSALGLVVIYSSLTSPRSLGAGHSGWIIRVGSFGIMRLKHGEISLQIQLIIGIVEA